MKKTSGASEEKARERQKIVQRVGLVTICVNFILAAGKLTAGFVGKSTAMISDAVHSFSDVISTIIVIIGAKLAGNKADHEHNYGHEKFESIATILLAMVLFATAIALFYAGIKSILAASASDRTFTPPTAVALTAAIVSIVVKGWMYFYTVFYARKIASQALKADAWHHLSDSLSSVGSFIGILGAMLGVFVLDGIATLVISLLIGKVSIDIVLQVIRQLTDHAASDETVAKIKKIIADDEQVLRLDDLKTRICGSVIYVDAEIAVDRSLNIVEAHAIAQTVHDQIERELGVVKHVNVHVNPYLAEETDESAEQEIPPEPPQDAADV